MSTKKPSTDLQKLAQKENYALFTLASMKSNLHHLKGLGDLVLAERIRNISNLLLDCQTRIRVIQTERKRARRDTKEFI